MRRRSREVPGTYGHALQQPESTFKHWAEPRSKLLTYSVVALESLTIYIYTYNPYRIPLQGVSEHRRHQAAVQILAVPERPEVNVRILHSGSKAKDKGDSRSPSWYIYHVVYPGTLHHVPYNILTCNIRILVFGPNPVRFLN